MDDAAVQPLPDDPRLLKALLIERAQLLGLRENRIAELEEQNQRIVELEKQNQQIELENQQIKLEIQRIESLRQQRIAELEQARAELERANAEAELDKLRLKQQLMVALKKLYGPRGDRLADEGDVAQLLLEFATALEAKPVDAADLPTEAGAIDPQTVRRVKRRKGRRDLGSDEFDHLPVIRREYDLKEQDKPCPCCNQPRVKIGKESSWQIEYIPGYFQRIEHVRIKYACGQCEQNALNPQIELADKPLQPIEKGMAGPGLLAYVITSKFADYLPLYRLENIFARNGLSIDRVTQCIWCRDVANLIKPLYDRMTQRLLGSHVICTDDTVMPMLAPGKTKQARMWIYLGDAANPYNVFDFTQSRSRDGPARFLEGYGLDKLTAGKQTILADAYGGYDGICIAGGITQAGCWAHARRKFVDTRDLSPQIADGALLRIGKLFAIEQQVKDASPEERLKLRQSQSRSIVTELREKLLEWKQTLLPKHPVAGAINYALNQWNPLTVFLSDGQVAIHNNLAEQEMKRIALNRKNSLFVGNERGGETAAILSSFTSTCRRHGIDPQIYFTQLLTNLPSTPISQLDSWLPDRWKQAK
jgi:transposase